MADNKVVSAAIGVGPTVATDEIAGIDHLRIKVEFGVDGSAVDVSATDPMPVILTGASTLPTGASTSALQTSNGVLLGAVTETAPATDTASSGLNGRLQRIAQRLTSILAQLGFGQAVMASSLPVAIASNQTAVPISAASLPLPALAATSTLQSSTEVLVGAVTETAPGTDTASSGLNGRLQRIAQRITSLIALLPGSLGQKTMANSLAVTLASDQSALATTVASLPLPSGASTEATLASALTSLQLIDDVVVADDAAFTPATTKVAMAGFTFDDVTPDSVNEGDAGAARMSANRNVYTTIRDAAGNERGANVTAAGALQTDSSATTQPISAASLPLPTGAATAATQATTETLIGAVVETAPATDTASSGLNGRLQRVAQRITSLIALVPTSLGIKTAANSFAVTLPSDGTLPLPTGAATSVIQTSNGVLLGAVTETAPATDTASSGLNGRLQRVAQRLTSLIAQIPAALGQTTMANSLAVTLASNQSALAITAASLPLPAGAATDAKLDTVITDLGTVTETAPASDTASSGLNGRLQRIAQRLTSLIALLPGSLGTKTAANSLAITPSSDGNFAIGDGTNLASIQTVGADAVSNTANRLRVTNTNMGFNGSTFDRLRAGVVGESGAATGYANTIPATGAVSGASIVSTTGAVEASRVLKASAGTLMSLVGYNNKTAAQFIQVFNSATVPADATVPIYTFSVPAKSNFSLDVPVTGMPFTTGIAVSNSSTLATKTIGSADCFFTAVIK